jgi:hypothetical protein
LNAATFQTSNMCTCLRSTWPDGSQSLHPPMKTLVIARYCYNSAMASSRDPQKQEAQRVQFAPGASASCHPARVKARDAAYKCHCWTPPGLANTATRKGEERNSLVRPYRSVLSLGLGYHCCQCGRVRSVADGLVRAHGWALAEGGCYYAR